MSKQLCKYAIDSLIWGSGRRINLDLVTVKVQITLVSCFKRGPVLSKHLDTWWSGMECKMADIISRDDICNYFDLVGNHDEPDLFLFVKTAEHLCTLDFNCRLPTGKYI